MYQISKEGKNLHGNINISGSKSESNRLLTLRAYTSFFNINNLSDSDDTKTMISSLKSDKEVLKADFELENLDFLAFLPKISW